MVRIGRAVIRVGFAPGFANPAWLGGISYFRNLLGALRDDPELGIEPLIVAPRDTPGEALAPFERVEVIRTALVEPGRLAWKARRALQRYAARDVLFESFMQRHRIDVLSHSGFLGRRCSAPTLPWIPDFQEMHFPEFFSVAEIGARRRNLQECCHHARRIIVSSKTALEDLVAARPACASRARVLHFVASMPPLPRLPAVEVLQARYASGSVFFHLPNQFWVHKNHKVVIDALVLLAARGRRALILCTGNMSDHRQPDHSRKVVQYARDRGVGESFRTLGIVPHDDLIGLMAASVAVINPSLFEGWSTTVEEGKSLGKCVILSDLAVHREQAPERALYFDPRDPEALAVCLVDALDRWDPAGEGGALKATAQRQPERRHAFARRFQHIVLDAVGSAPEDGERNVG